MLQILCVLFSVHHQPIEALEATEWDFFFLFSLYARLTTNLKKRTSTDHRHLLSAVYSRKASSVKKIKIKGLLGEISPNLAKQKKSRCNVFFVFPFTDCWNGISHFILFFFFCFLLLFSFTLFSNYLPFLFSSFINEIVWILLKLFIEFAGLR